MMTPPDKSAANRTPPSNPAQAAGLPTSRDVGSERLVQVFISSTAEDLKEHREAAREAAIGAKMLPTMMEYFVARGDKPPLPACLDRVSATNVLVVIVAQRYGWAPPDQDADQHKSITWLECERAIDDDKEVLAFLIDEKHPWPSDKTEHHRLTAAMQAGTANDELFREINRNVARLKEFKAWLSSRGIRATFTTPDQLRRCISDALHDWRRRHPTTGSPVGAFPSLPPDPAKYLRDLRESSGWIDIRGLQIGTGRTHRFPIEQLYISLTTRGAERADERGASGRRKRETAADERLLQEPRDRPLQEALRHDRLVVVGPPGGGKTTFLRRICHTRCQTELGDVPQAAEERLEIKDRTFPVFVRINELAEHILKHETRSDAPAGETARWLPHYLASLSGDSSWGLDAGYFQQQLEDGRCTVLLDGLDEAPRRAVRERMSRVIENVTAAYGRCRFVVTSRPSAYTGQVVLAGFAHAHIDPLSDEAVETFLSRWCAAVYPDSEGSARAHCDELLGAVRGRVEIRRMARNPVMLTALAVVLLQELALAMQDAPEGRQTQISKRWAAEQLAGEMDAARDRERVAQAEHFLDEEEVDSGIVVRVREDLLSKSGLLEPRGDGEVSFFHLSLQEFLAAERQFVLQRSKGDEEPILEGSKAGLTSKEFEIKLTNVAGASLEELLDDYYDYLRARDLPISDKESREAQYVRGLGRKTPQTYERYREFVETRPPEVVANIAICLIHQTNYLIDQQLLRLEQDFVEQGGLRERMTRVRIAHHNAKPTKPATNPPSNSRQPTPPPNAHNSPDSHDSHDSHESHESHESQTRKPGPPGGKR